MKPESISALAALASAFSAAWTTYLYRKQGKGFVWTKDVKGKINPLPDGKLHMEFEIPLFNLGSGTIRFKKMIAKKVYLKTNSVEPFELEMDEAYFPPGVQIVSYKTKVYSDFVPVAAPGLASEFRVHRFEANPGTFDADKYQQEINQKIGEIGPVLIILKCHYKDGSLFGLRTVSTTIAMEINGLDFTYLSPGKKKSLKKLFE